MRRVVRRGLHNIGIRVRPARDTVAICRTGLTRGHIADSSGNPPVLVRRLSRHAGGVYNGPTTHAGNTVSTILSRMAGRARVRWTNYRWSWLRRTRATTTLCTQQGLLTVSTADDVISRLLHAQGHYQLDVVTRALAFLRATGRIPERGKGCVWDVGANMGVISVGMLVAREFEQGVGIEPDPRNFDLLRQNVAQNGLSDRYTALKVAATAQMADLELVLSTFNWGDHRIVSTNGSHEVRRAVTVKGRPLDDVLAECPPPSLVWVDVQGHEGQVFQGGARAFAGGVPTVTEVWPYGIIRSGLTVADYCAEVARHWDTFWVWRQCGRYVGYPVAHLEKFCEEIGEAANSYDDVILTRG